MRIRAISYVPDLKILPPSPLRYTRRSRRGNMSKRAATSRRAFIETLGAGGLMLAARPVFSIGSAANDQVRLNYNESPYGPSEKALKAIRDSLSGFDGRYYEDTYYDNLSNVLAKHH